METRAAMIWFRRASLKIKPLDSPLYSMRRSDSPSPQGFKQPLPRERYSHPAAGMCEFDSRMRGRERSRRYGASRKSTGG
jgi:hypothetical protein